MFLFVAIAVICLLLSTASDIVKLLNVSKYIGSNTNSSASAELKEQLKQAQKELDRVRNSPASGEYAQFVKTMRAEQKVKEVESSMRSTRSMGRIKGASVDLIAGYVLKALLSFVLFVISVRNRYTPVMVFHETFNFTPLTGLLSFPTGVSNAVSVPIWVLSCNVTFSLISAIIKGKK